MSERRISASATVARLDPPSHPVRVVIDTDTYNEVDDQFALTLALLSPEKLHLEAFYAAPFHNARSSDPADGMERSYQEILKLTESLGRGPDGPILRGSTGYLRAIDVPQESEAASDLVERGMAERDSPLYVVAIGAITNVASALLMEPKLTEHIVVLWLGGHSLHWPHTREFNLKQDADAARILFDSRVPVVHFGCQGVASHLLTNLPELEAYVAGRGEIGDYLLETVRSYRRHAPGRSKVIWDLAPVAWLLDHEWVPSIYATSPGISQDLRWIHRVDGHPIRSAYFVERDAIFTDLFAKLSRAA